MTALRVVRHRRAVVLAALVTTAVAAWAARGVRADHDPRAFHPQGSPLVALTRDAEKVFGADDQIALVAVLDEALFTPAGLARVHALTEALSRLAGIDGATGITTVTGIRGDGEAVEVSPLVPVVPVDQAGADGARAALFADDLVAGTLLSPAGDACLIQLVVLESWSSPDRRADLHDRIAAVLAEREAPGVRLLLGGFPMVRVQYSRELLSETGRLMALAVLVLLVLTVVLLRSVTGGLLTLGVVIVANVWTHGLMAAFDEPVTILSMLTPIIVLIVGVADAVHVILAFRRLEGTREERAVEALRSMAPAGLLTAATTAIGFLALLTAGDVRMLRVFGVFTATGVMFAWVATVLLVPALLASRRLGFDARRPPRASAAIENGLGARLVRHRGVTLAACALVVACLGAVAATVSTDAKILDGLRDDHPIMVTYHALEDRFGGTLPLQVVYDAGSEDAVSEPAVLRHMKETAETLRADPTVGTVVSPDALVRRFHRAIAGTDTIPDSADAIAETWLAGSFGDPNPFDRLVRPEEGYARIQALLYERGSHATHAAVDRVQSDLDARPLPGVRVGLAGTAYIAPVAWEWLLDDMVWSSVLAVGAITLLFALLFRSVPLALLTIPPNVVPLVTVLAAMAALDIPVKGNNAVIFSIAYGVAVDDTIYFLAHLRRLWRGGLAWPDAVLRAHADMTAPLLTTSLVLGAGFAVFLASTFEFSVTLGLQMLVCVGAGAAAELVMMPALLALLPRRLVSRV